MKAQVRQLRVELKYIKKGNISITEVVLRVKDIVNSLLTVGDIVSEQDQIDSIFDGLPKEYNLNVIQMYGITEPQSLYNVEALIHVQEA